MADLEQQKPAALRKRSEFVRVQQTGAKLRGRQVLLVACPALGGARAARIGLTVSRRVGGAVVRNKVKRRLRAIWRAHSALFSGPIDIVLIALPSAAQVSFSRLSEDVQWLLKKALARAQPSASSACTSACSRH